jgi:hypothetical protein
MSTATPPSPEEIQDAFEIIRRGSDSALKPYRGVLLELISRCTTGTKRKRDGVEAILKEIKDLDEPIKKRIQLEPSKWVGSTSSKEDIRVIISRAANQKTALDRYELALTEISFAIEYSIWRAQKGGNDRQRYNSVKQWSREVGEPESLDVRQRAATRSLKALSVGSTFGYGICLYLAEIWWKFAKLNKDEMEKLYTALQSEEFAKTNEIVCSPQAVTFVCQSQMLFHNRHSLSHLNRLDNGQGCIQPTILLPVSFEDPEIRAAGIIKAMSASTQSAPQSASTQQQTYDGGYFPDQAQSQDAMNDIERKKSS